MSKPNEPILYVDSSRIRAAKLEEAKAAMETLAEFVATNEPQLISYGFFLDPDESRMTVVAVHPDSNSLEFHMDVAGPGFREFTDLIELSTIDIYGPLDDELVARLEEKAEMLGTNAVVTVHRRQAGFARFDD